MPTRTVTLQFLGDSKQLQTAMDEAGLSADKNASTIGTKFDGATTKAASGFSKLGQKIQDFTGIPVAGVFDKISSKFDEADTKGQKFGQTMKTIGGASVLAGGAALVAIGAASVEMADKFDTAAAQYNVAARAQGESSKTASTELSKTSSAMVKLGFNSTTTASALTIAARITGSTAEQTKIMSVAADVARAKNIDLSTATMLVGKATQGNVKGLAQLGINLNLGSGKAKALAADQLSLANANRTLAETQQKISDGLLKGVPAEQALANAQDAVSQKQQKLTLDQKSGGATLDAIAAKTKGAAEAYGKTLAGQMSVADAQVHNLATSFGEKLVPILAKVMSVLAGVIGWLEKNKPVAIALAAIVGGILVAAMVAWAASLFAVDGALSFITVPILLVVAAVALLAAGVYEVIKHWGAIASFFSKVWGDIRKFFDKGVHDVVDVIKGWWPLILGVLSGGVLLLPALIVKYWAQISKAASDIIDAVVGFFQRLPGRIVTALGDIVGTIWGALTASGTWIDTNVLQPVVTFFTGLPGRAVTALGNIIGTIFGTLLGAQTWIDSNVLTPVVSYIVSFPGRVVTGLGNIVGTIFGGLSGAWTWIKTNVYDPIVTGFQGLPADLETALSGGLSVFDKVGKSIVNSIITGVNTIIDTIDSGIASVSIFGWHPPAHVIPDIPTLSTGGIVQATPGGTLVRLGEGGRDEAVVPMGGANSSTLGGRGTSVTVNANTNADPHEIAAQVGWILR